MHARWYEWVTDKRNVLEGTINLACGLAKFIEKSNIKPIPTSFFPCKFYRGRN